jgi:hypothetical protein
VPRERVPCGLTGVSPDGRYFVYPHAELAWWEANLAAGPQRSSAKGVNIMIVELATGKTRPIVSINSWITHTNFSDNSRITLSHPPTEQGIMMTDLSGEWMLSLRPQSPDGRQTCHYQSTKRGVMYELNDYGSVVDRGHGMMGVFNPETMKRREYRVAARITHIGLDPEGLLWFGEQIIEKPRFGRLIGYCPRLTPDAEGEFVPLTEPIVTCGDQNLQRAHVHPSLMPDRRHILFTGGDLRNRTNHPCLLDVADLAGLHSEKAG